MTAGAHDSGAGFGKSAGVNAARGFAVVAIAVLVGVLLMMKGIKEDDSVAGSENSEEVATDGTGDAADGTDTDGNGDATDGTGTEGTGTDVEGTEADPVELDGEGSTEEPDESVVTEPATGPRDPAEVVVLVLNGSGGIKGIAGKGTAQIADAGYATATADDALSDGPTLILYVEGYEAEANAVAAEFGVEGRVEAFSLETSPVADTQGAHVIVRIGNDGLIG